MGIEERARFGLTISPKEIQKTPETQDYFLGLRRFLKGIRQSADPLERKRQVIEGGLYPYCKLPFSRERDVQREYERYGRCIARAQRSYKTFVHDTFVSDIEQRVGVHPLVDGVSDPEQLIDIALNNRNVHFIPRFEARRALHLGALFFEYETHFGTQQELEETLYGLNLFLMSQLAIDSRSINTRIYHKTKPINEQSEWFEATDIRVPLFEDSKERGTSEKKQFSDENALYVTFHAMNLPGHAVMPGGHVLFESRVKDPWSAAMKAIRKDTSIQELTDCLGCTFYLYPHDAQVFDSMVSALEGGLHISPKDRHAHPVRRPQSAPWMAESHVEQNDFSSDRFKMEKMIALWRSDMLWFHRESVGAMLPFSTQENKDAFWKKVSESRFRTTPFEIQIGLIHDFINNRHVPSEENHAIYRAVQSVGKKRKGKGSGEVNILNILNPVEFYGINFSDPAIFDALITMQKNRFGLVQKAEKND